MEGMVMDQTKIIKLTLVALFAGSIGSINGDYSEDPSEIKAEISTASTWHLNNLLLNNPDDSSPEMYTRINFIIKRHDEGNIPGLDENRIKIWRKALKEKTN